MKLTHFFLLLGLFALFSCSSTPANKEAFLVKFDTFMDEVKADHKDYTQEDWEAKNEKLEVLLEEWYPELEEDFSAKELSHIWARAATYAAWQQGDMIGEFWEENGEEIREAIKENAKYLSREGAQLLKEAIPELKEVGKEIMDELRKGMDELKEELEKEKEKE